MVTSFPGGWARRCDSRTRSANWSEGLIPQRGMQDIGLGTAGEKPAADFERTRFRQAARKGPAEPPARRRAAWTTTPVRIEAAIGSCKDLGATRRAGLRRPVDQL